jgi:hypothetical protein
LAFAQLPGLDSLRIQGAPALAISENAPTEVAQPTGARDFGLSLLGGTSGSDYAFEIKPYWWGTHNINFDYYTKPAWGWDAIEKSFSISGARYEYENTTGTDVAGVSLGVAFDLVRGPASRKFHEALDRTETEFQGTIDPRNPQAGYEQLFGEKHQKAAADAVAELVKGRVGWNASFATAASWEFKDTDYNGGEFAKFGSWFVGSYTPDTDGDQISYIGLARVLNDQGVGKDDVYFDIGARLMWSMHKIPLTISAEYIQRLAQDTDDDSRYSALLEYQINDSMALFVSHGWNFDQTSNHDEVLTMAGLSFGIGH